MSKPPVDDAENRGIVMTKKGPRVAPLRGYNRTVEGMPYAERWQPGQPRKQWNPVFAQKIAWYPKSPESFARWQESGRKRMQRLHAEGRFPKRTGIPNGWGGRVEELKACREAGAAAAEEIVKYMVEKNIVSLDDERSEIALKDMVAIIQSQDEANKRPAYPAKDRIAAARTVLEYTRQKPASKQEVAITKAEDFLAAVVADMKAGA